MDNQTENKRRAPSSFIEQLKTANALNTAFTTIGGTLMRLVQGQIPDLVGSAGYACSLGLAYVIHHLNRAPSPKDQKRFTEELVSQLRHVISDRIMQLELAAETNHCLLKMLREETDRLCGEAYQLVRDRMPPGYLNDLMNDTGTKVFPYAEMSLAKNMICRKLFRLDTRLREIQNSYRLVAA